MDKQMDRCTNQTKIMTRDAIPIVSIWFKSEKRKKVKKGRICKKEKE